MRNCRSAWRKGTSVDKRNGEGLKDQPKAWKNFNQLTPGYRKQYVGWLQSAKRPETRKKRLAEAISLLEANKKLGMK